MNKTIPIRLLFGATIFVAATLLFVVQPMVAKAILPSLGGSSAVWTTCMLFFQSALLAGYAWAHGGASRLSLRQVVFAHLGLVLAAAATLPFALESDLEAAGSPVTWVLSTLTLAVGPTFVALAATSPLLQAWYARLGQPDSSDPYYLYAASNLGSMLALLAYPVAIEPFLGVRSQLETWAWTFGGLVVLLAGCAVVTWRRGADEVAPKERGRREREATWPRITVWVGLAFIPSSLMLGATQHVTIDLAPVPLLWVLPLAAYLGSFIIVFAHDTWRIPESVTPWIPAGILVLVALEGFDIPMVATVTVHIIGFSILALLFHGWLADLRPAPRQLTTFYLAMAVGGALGGLFNGVLAPVAFSRNLDYLLVLALAMAIVPVGARHFDELKPRAIPLLGLVTIGLFYLWAVGALPWPPLRNIDRILEWTASLGGLGIAFLISARWPRFHHLAYAIVFTVGAWSIVHTPGAVRYDRSFYATYKVFDRSYSGLRVRKFSHGTTSHGAQFIDPSMRRIPTAYHHPSGPVGQVVRAFPHQRAAVVGLGIGAMAAYPAGPDRWDFFEIDPLVEQIARQDFWYLDDCGERCSVDVGDGRLLLTQQPDHAYDIIFLDAYNSDSVPTHLLTTEALLLYRKKLRPGGILVFHVSNRYIDVEGVVGALITHAGMTSRTQVHFPSNDLRRLQVRVSAYVVAADSEDILNPIIDDPRWSQTQSRERPWTDDNSNIIEALEL